MVDFKFDIELIEETSTQKDLTRQFSELYEFMNKEIVRVMGLPPRLVSLREQPLQQLRDQNEKAKKRQQRCNKPGAGDVDSSTEN